MKTGLKLLLAPLLLVALAFTACATSTGAIEGVTWVLDSYGPPGNLQPVLPDAETSAEFNHDDAQVAGSAGCNRYFGSYQLDGNKLSFTGPLGSTMMACPELIMEQEMAYLRVLQLAETYEIDGDELWIYSGDQVLVFQRGQTD